MLRNGFNGVFDRRWWTIALAIQFFHHIEHLLLIIQSTTGYNLGGRPVPTSIVQMWVPRVELHLFYNTIVFIPMVVAMYYHMFPTRSDARPGQKCTCNWEHGVTASRVTSSSARVRRPAVACRRTLSCGGGTPERRCSSFCCSSHPSSCCTDSSVRRSLPPISQPSCRGCSTAGWLIIVLLAAGNFFCTGCPFVLVRDAGRRLRRRLDDGRAGFASNGSASRFFVAVLFTYELFDLWALPRATAWLVLGYFAAALAIDLSVHRSDLL